MAEDSKKVTRDPETGEIDLSIDTPFHVSGIDLPLSHLKVEIPTILKSGYAEAELKLAEATFFLECLEAYMLNQVAAIYFLDAFLSAARAVTWVLKKQCSHLPDFESWYVSWEAKMAADPRFGEFKERRNEAEKRALHRPSITYYTKVHYRLNATVERGETTAKIAFAKNGKEVPLVPECRAYLDGLRAIVKDAREKGFFSGSKDNASALGIELLQELPNGEWRHFDPAQYPAVKPEDFPNRKAYDVWARDFRTRLHAQHPPPK